MFLDVNDRWPAPGRWEPKRPVRITPGQQRLIGRLVLFNLLMLLLAPFAGATLFDAVLMLVRR